MRVGAARRRRVERVEGKWEEGESQAEERVAGRDQYELNLNIFCTGVSPVMSSPGTTDYCFKSLVRPFGQELDRVRPERYWASREGDLDAYSFVCVLVSREVAVCMHHSRSRSRYFFLYHGAATRTHVGKRPEERHAPSPRRSIHMKHILCEINSRARSDRRGVDTRSLTLTGDVFTLARTCKRYR